MSNEADKGTINSYAHQTMTLTRAQEVLGRIAAYDIENGPRGEESREAINLAIVALETAKSLIAYFHFSLPLSEEEPQ